MPVTLPPEILDQVLMFLRPNMDSLKACSRAHPFLSTIAQPHLFAYVRVHNDSRTVPNMFSCGELFNTLKSKPHLTRYIYKLAVDLFHLDHSLEDITSILSMDFPNLVAVELAGAFEPWRHLCKFFRASFMACLALPSIREVTMKRVKQFPLAEFDRCKGLVKLTIDGHFAFSTNFEHPSQLNPNLESLSICHRCSGCLPRVLSWAKTLNLRHLDVSPSVSSVEDPSLLPRLFQACPSITNLELDFRHDFRTVYGSAATPPVSTNLDLSGLTNLTELTVHAVMYLSFRYLDASLPSSSIVWYESSIPAILRLFKTAPSSTKHLTLHLFFILDENATISDIPDWRELTSFFVDPSASSLHPECIKLYVSARSMSRDLPPSEILPSLQEDPTLKGLCRRGVLTINPEVHLCRYRNCCDHE